MSNLDMKALFKIGYGLYVVTSTDGVNDNGLILNSIMQLTEDPVRIAVSINKKNYSHDLIKSTGIMNVNCLTTEAPFRVFETFGFVSGRDKNKFEGCTPRRSENGLAVLPKYINAWFSLKVENYTDLGTHGLFICSMTEAEVVSTLESMSYAYYHKNVKPKPEKQPKAKGWICTVCGYIHDEEPGEDFECPICKHGRDVFEPIE